MALAGLLGFGAWQGAQGVYIEAKAMLAQHLILRAWNATRAGAIHAHPWPWADTEPVARLVVPGEDVDLVILAGASGRTLAFGPGHLTGTPLPGEAGNAVVSGHRDTHFAFLARLTPGDELAVQRRDGQWRRYVVTDAEVVDQKEVTLDPRHHDDTRLTLVTCYPFAALRPGGPLRYVVTARAAASKPEARRDLDASAAAGGSAAAGPAAEAAGAGQRLAERRRAQVAHGVPGVGAVAAGSGPTRKRSGRARLRRRLGPLLRARRRRHRHRAPPPPKGPPPKPGPPGPPPSPGPEGAATAWPETEGPAQAQVHDHERRALAEVAGDDLFAGPRGRDRAGRRACRPLPGSLGSAAKAGRSVKTLSRFRSRPIVML